MLFALNQISLLRSFLQPCQPIFFHAQKVLLAKGADVNAVDWLGKTALTKAACENHFQIVEVSYGVQYFLLLGKQYLSQASLPFWAMVSLQMTS